MIWYQIFYNKKIFITWYNIVLYDIVIYNILLYHMICYHIVILMWYDIVSHDNYLLRPLVSFKSLKTLRCFSHPLKYNCTFQTRFFLFFLISDRSRCSWCYWSRYTWFWGVKIRGNSLWIESKPKALSWDSSRNQRVSEIRVSRSSGCDVDVKGVNCNI